jgi:hypothetical protein
MRSRSSIAAPARRRLAVVGLAIMLLAVPAATIATDQFSDVANTNQFHDNINNLADAGITRGCGDGTTYCPTNAVNRQQMAGFLNRGLGRAATGWGFIGFDEAATTYVTGTTVTTGGLEGGTGFVVVTASATAYTAVAGVCPCELAVYVEGPSEISPAMWFDVSDTVTPTGYRNGSGTVSWVFAAPSGTEQTYLLGVDVSATGTLPTTDDTAIEGTITAVYVPFGSDGSVSLDGGGLETLDNAGREGRSR